MKDNPNFFCEFAGSQNYALNSKVEVTKEYSDRWSKQFINDNDWKSGWLDGYFASADHDCMVIFDLQRKLALRMVVVKPGKGLKLLRVLVSDEKPNVANNKFDPSTAVECGTFKQNYQAEESDGPLLPISLTCEKCMPYGKYVILQNGVETDENGNVIWAIWTDNLRLGEVAIYGVEMNL